MFGRKRKAIQYSAGLDIGSSSIKLVVLREGIPHLQDLEALPKGSMDRGRIQNENAVSDALRRLWKRSGLKSAGAHVSFNNTYTLLRRLERPHNVTDVEDLASALGIEAQEALDPMDATKLRLHYHALDKDHIALITQAPMAVNEISQVMKNARLKPLSLQISNMALPQALVPQSYCYGILDIGAQLTTYTVIIEKAVEYMRLIPVGVDDLIQKIEQIRPGEGQNLYMASVMGELTDSEVQAEILTFTDTFVQTINATTQQCRMQNMISPEIIYLTGGGSLNDSLVEALKEYGTAHTEKFVMPDGFELSNDHSLYHVAIGTAIGDGAVNFLPGQKGTEKLLRPEEVMPDRGSQPLPVFEDPEDRKAPIFPLVSSSILVALLLAAFYFGSGWIKDTDNQALLDDQNKVTQASKDGEIELVSTKDYQDRTKLALPVLQAKLEDSQYLAQYLSATLAFKDAAVSVSEGSLKENGSIDFTLGASEEALDQALTDLKGRGWQVVKQDRAVGDNWTITILGPGETPNG